MIKTIEQILAQDNFNKSDLMALLNANAEDTKLIFAKAAATKKEYVGNKVYFRGLIEFSNICSKNCYYCGIRAGNQKLQRYYVSEAELLEAVKYAYDEKYASIVIQSGERSDTKFTAQMSEFIKKIMQLTNNEIAITLSLGEQSKEVYQEWFDLGAHRYLLRIEASNKELYQKLHPGDSKHSYEERLQALHYLKEIGYQVGTGVMIGLPYQTIDNLTDDLIFMRDFDVDMIGMGPYIEHEDTPLYQFLDTLIPKSERFQLSLKMVAIMRIMMKDINIAATTAMQTLDSMGREKALKVGANVIMPNLTPVKYRANYLLYEDKPCIDEEASECKNCLEARIHLAGDTIAYGEQGTSRHYKNKKKK